MEDTQIMETFRRQVLEKPEAFFTPSESMATSIAQFAKYLFDQAKQCESENVKSSLDTLYVDGFDADQIWEQLKLQNEPVAKEVNRQVKKLTKDSSHLSFFSGATSAEDNGDSDEAGDDIDDEDIAEENDEEHDEEDEEEADGDMEVEDEVDEDVDDDDDDDLVEKPKKKSSTKKRKRQADELEDGFFDWDEMEKAAEEEELDESDDGDDDLDGGDDDDEGDDNEGLDDDFEDEDDDGLNEKTATYKDLFDEPNEGDDDDEGEDDDEDEEEEEKPKAASLKRKIPLTEDEEEELAERGILSSHQRRSSHLQQQIESLEEEALGEKHWTLKGEVKASVRPENSLLEATLEYDRPTKVAPIITVEVTQELEELIKQRIRDDNYNDVIRKFAVNETAQKEATELSMEKSKEGLGEIYEKEYMKTALGFEDNSEMKKEQEEIEIMFQKLCWKLDALTNFHFTPKPVVREMAVQSAAPAISMEEAVPIGVSDANLHAPEDVYDKKHKREGVVRSREEMSQDERKAARNAKKHARRKARQQKESDEKLVAKVNPGMGNKYEKKKMLESLQAKNVTKGKEIEGSTRQFSNSSEFFSRLQDEQAAGGKPRPKPTASKDPKQKSGAFYKL
ncbi:Aste57867_24451 [Aphanomyces stellatus]|uniref:U3 small nucleolar ribonucleoprotein protein MPP10 n=1 Tax=Aphanomyces stellatus TaxID=120398 RepID=A0A485LQP4_9STRA|nr:hypothetical protein As57867_024375 [Aphanomyces stellatus]VFU01091.1 Aste57867_24451 [Aphanomyces stellatus]